MTEVDQGGGVGEAVMEDHWGSPEREKEVTVQPRAVADLQIRLPGGGGLVGLGWEGRETDRGNRCRRRRRCVFWTLGLRFGCEEGRLTTRLA